MISTFLIVFLFLGALCVTNAFTPMNRNAAFLSWRQHVMVSSPTPFRLHATASSVSSQSSQDLITKLIADDELITLSLKLGEIVRDSVFECAKRFQFRPDQIAWEIDKRVKLEVAHMMGKEEFKLLDFIFALNTIGKEKLQEVAGDDTVEYEEMVESVDTNVRNFLFDFTGKQDADAQDIEDALQDRVKARVMEVVGLPDFSLEAWARDMDRKRNEYLVESLGQWGADRANEVTNMAMKTITGKETYEFGDISRKIAADIFGSDSKK